jgi:ADP-L-glycero-D-manno-heptose 6-epimerase
MLLMACQLNGVNLQYASSASVYGLNQDFREDAPLNPMSPYAWSKYLFDRHVLSQQFDKIRVQGFRYFNVYGPYEDHKGDQSSPHHKFTKQAETTGVIKLFEGSENYKRDFISVHEVVKIHKKFFDVQESGIWNAGTGRATSFENVARTIADGMECRVEYIPMPDNVKAQYQTYTCADVTKLRKHYP